MREVSDRNTEREIEGLVFLFPWIRSMIRFPKIPVQFERDRNNVGRIGREQMPKKWKLRLGFDAAETRNTGEG